jgi:hypothetical protein
MRLSILLVALCMIAPALRLEASEPCMMVAMHDTPAIESPNTIWKSGVKGAITTYAINKKTGVESFCFHGGFCYAAWVSAGGQAFEALRRPANCRIEHGGTGMTVGDETYYDLEAAPAQAAAPPSEAGSVQNIKAIHGNCGESSFTADGPATEDLTNRRGRFTCDGAAMFFMDNQYKAVTIRFLDTDHIQTAAMLGFAGVMQSDGTTLKVTSMFYVDPNGKPMPVASDSACTLAFVKPNLTGIQCFAHLTSNGRKYLGVVDFHAAPGQ